MDNIQEEKIRVLLSKYVKIKVGRKIDQEESIKRMDVIIDEIKNILSQTVSQKVATKKPNTPRGGASGLRPKTPTVEVSNDITCPDCDGEGCGQCKGKGKVFASPSDVGGNHATASRHGGGIGKNRHIRTSKR